MCAIDCRVSQLTHRELGEINSAVIQCCEDSGIIGCIFVEGIILHQEDIRQSAVITGFSRCDQCSLDIAIYLLLNV